MIFYIFITKSLTIWTDTLCLAYEWNWFYSVLTGSIQYKTHVLIFIVTILHILSILNLTYLFVGFFLTSYDLTKKVIDTFSLAFKIMHQFTSRIVILTSYKEVKGVLHIHVCGRLIFKYSICVIKWQISFKNIIYYFSNFIILVTS